MEKKSKKGSAGSPAELKKILMEKI